MIIENAKFFLKNIEENYSVSSSKNKKFKSSKYLILYNLVLKYLLEAEDSTQLKKKLYKLEKKLENGLICEDPSIFTPGKHSRSYVSLHASSIYYQLVNSLNESHPPIQYFQNFTEEKIQLFVDDLNYDDAWRVSNEVMALSVLIAFNNKKGFNKNQLRIIIDSVNNKQNKKTGVWDSRQNKSLINGVAAAFHYIPLYDYLNEEIPFKNELLSSVLSLSLNNGYFSSPKGYACIDYDCVAILRYLLKINKNKNFISKEDLNFIYKNIYKLYLSLIDSQNSDGGFGEFGRGDNFFLEIFESTFSFKNHKSLSTFSWNLKKIIRLYFFPTKVLYSNSIKECSSLAYESNIFATWFRLITINICEEILHELEPSFHLRLRLKKFELPGLGRI